VSFYANYNYISWLADQGSEKGSAKLHVKSIDFTGRTAWQYAGREGLLFWTIVAMTGFRTHPEHTPDRAAREAIIAQAMTMTLADFRRWFARNAASFLVD
jgi:hypothetical protein